MKPSVIELLTTIVFVAILYALVRPGSPAAGAVKTVSTALVALVSSATGVQSRGSTLSSQTGISA